MKKTQYKQHQLLLLQVQEELVMQISWHARVQCEFATSEYYEQGGVYLIIEISSMLANLKDMCRPYNFTVEPESIAKALREQNV